MVETRDLLGLVTESMGSALARTSGYVLDFPGCNADDHQVVAEFVERLRSLSTAPDDQLFREFLQDGNLVYSGGCRFSYLARV